jgi:hypothetical protein
MGMTKTVIILPYQSSWDALHWAKKNCPSYITCDVHRVMISGQEYFDSNFVEYYFSCDNDATMFALKWL